MSHAREIRIAAMKASVNFMEISGSRSLAHDKQKSRFGVICFFVVKKI